MRQRVWRLVVITVAAVATLSIVALVFDAGPLHAARCYVGGREGWFVEYPRDAVTADDIREVIPSCVPVHVG